MKISKLVTMKIYLANVDYFFPPIFFSEEFFLDQKLKNQDAVFPKKYFHTENIKKIAEK